MPPRRVRRLVAPAVVSVVLLALAAPIALADHSLRIVVTNDDGWIGADGSSTPLIVAPRNALAADACRAARAQGRRSPCRRRGIRAVVIELALK